MKRRGWWTWGLTLGAVGVLAGPGGAQELGDRIRAVDGDVVFRMELRDGVEVCENGIRTKGHHRSFQWGDDRGERACSEGLAEVVATVRGGEIRALDLDPWEGPGSSPRGAVDLGRVSGPRAASFLISLARSDRDESRVGKEALMMATLGRDVRVWPDLLDVARDRTLDEELRSSAVFWLGQAAADAATGGLAELARDDTEDQKVRDAAVFALSQRPDDEGVPVLMELARSAREAETRKTAIFWLSQSGDARVLDFFEEVLLGRAGG